MCKNTNTRTSTHCPNDIIRNCDSAKIFVDCNCNCFDDCFRRMFVCIHGSPIRNYCRVEEMVEIICWHFWAQTYDTRASGFVISHRNSNFLRKIYFASLQRHSLVCVRIRIGYWCGLRHITGVCYVCVRIHLLIMNRCLNRAPEFLWPYSLSHKYIGMCCFRAIACGLQTVLSSITLLHRVVVMFARECVCAHMDWPPLLRRCQITCLS